jgi:competence protein ComGC
MIAAMIIVIAVVSLLLLREIAIKRLTKRRDVMPINTVWGKELIKYYNERIEAVSGIKWMKFLKKQ